MVSVEMAAERAVEEMLSRALNNSAEWLAELVSTAPPDFAAQTMRPAAAGDESPTGRPSVRPSVVHASLRSTTRTLLLQSLLQTQQYQRCYHMGKSDDDPLVRFIAFYALYLDGERQGTLGSAIAMQAASGASSSSTTTPFVSPLVDVSARPPSFASRNPHLADLRALLDATKPHSFDGYLRWLSGVVYRAQGRTEEALREFKSAVNQAPLLFCAWKDMSLLVSNEAELQHIVEDTQSVAPAFMIRVFIGLVKTDWLTHIDEAIAEWQALAAMLPESNFVACHVARCCYAIKDMLRARDTYDIVHRRDRYRLDCMDDYSNVLFVLNDRVAMSSLAHHCFKVDPFRAESNCIAGNYYTLMRKHPQSLLHFRRAIAINPLYSSAWTLLGHEYLEVKNTTAAVEAYRAAVDIDPRDFRAWYGLGQIYELLSMHHYALHYYWHTTTLCPQDPRMWSAVAGSLEKQHRTAEAMACYERVELCEPPDSDYYSQLCASLGEYYAHSQPVKAAKFFEKSLTSGGTVAEKDCRAALMFLSSHLTLQAQSLVDFPARSPSYDPIAVPQPHHGSEGNTMLPRPSLDVRKRQAAEYVNEAEGYLRRLEEQMGMDPLDEEIVRRQKQIDHTRVFLNS